MKYSKIIGLTIVASAALLTACTDDLANIFNNEHEIAFEVKTTSANDTRATDSIPEIEPVKLTADNGETYYLHTDITPMPESIQPADTSVAVTRGATADATSLHDGFGVTAYNTDGTTEGSSYFLNSSTSYTTVSTTDVYTPTGAGSGKYWPKGKLNFYAYYPYTSAVTGTDSEDTHGLSRSTDGKTIKYVVPSTPANQPDLMTAKLENQQYSSGDGRAALTFNHALCAISFKTGTDIAGGTINSITFNNVYTEGKYDISTDTWSDTSAGDVSVTCNVATTEGTANTSILTDNNTLMMIPHPDNFTAGEAASITINFTPSGSTARNLTYSLTGTKWEKGKHITYTITTDGLVWEYVLEATGGSTTYAGGSVSYSVKSYRYKRTNTSVKEAVAWQIDGYKADGASDFSSSAPSWLTVGSGQDSGTGKNDATAESKTVTVSAQTSTTSSASFTSVERGTSSDPYDLSTHDFNGNTTTRNTANCYVVNAPGWYKIPLVYGNGIKNGVNNTSAYNSSTSTFVDYKNNQIKNLTGPYIKYSGTPNSAVLLWQDAENLIQNLSYDNTDDGYLKFYISPSTIKEGNALIAVRDNSANNIIMWSWHIWVSAVDYEKTITVTANDGTTTYDFMPVNVGWCNLGNLTSYPARSTKVRLKQAVNNVTSILTISQNPYNYASTSGNCTSYQWGRKDPVPPMSGISNEGKPLYNSYFTHLDANPARQATIRNPHVYYYGSVGQNWIWSNTSFYDSWSVGQTYVSPGASSVKSTTNTIKSVYDPSPVGFKVPPTFAFSALSSSSNIGQSNSITHANNGRFVTGSWSRGAYFWTNNSKTEKIFIPSIGYHSYNNSSWVYGDDDTCSSPYCVNCVHRAACDATPNFSISINQIVITSSYATCWSFLLRPIAE